MRIKPLALMIMTILALLALLGIGCQNKNETAEPGEKNEPANRVALNQAALTSIKLETARIREFADPVSCVGTAAIDPRQTVQITPIVSGKIESVSAYEGDRVIAGQLLATLYSPDLITAQSEFLQILKGFERGQKGEAEEQSTSAQMLAAAAEKMRLLGMTPEEIGDLRKSRKVYYLLNLRSPISGTVIEAQAVRGSYHEANRALFTIADLSRLRVDAGIYEKDIGRIRSGATADLTFSAFPGETFAGKVILLGNRLDPETRTLAARIEIDNPAIRIKPGMYATVSIRRPTPEMLLAVPESAVRKIGGKTSVFIPGQKGEFFNREVKTGRTWEGWVEIVSGLTAGQLVVTEGSFLIKSEMLKKNLEGE